MEQRIQIPCFTHDPSIKSSLKFLRRTESARDEVVELFLESKGLKIKEEKKGKINKYAFVVRLKDESISKQQIYKTRDLDYMSFIYLSGETRIFLSRERVKHKHNITSMWISDGSSAGILEQIYLVNKCLSPLCFKWLRNGLVWRIHFHKRQFSKPY